MDSLPLLWHFPISHYNEKARWALDWKAVPHRREALLADYLFRAWWATGRAKLPILHLDGRAIGDSTAIIAALEERWPEPPLYPKDPADRARALGIEDWFDEQVGDPVRTLIVGEAFARDPQGALDVLASSIDHPSLGLLRRVLPFFSWFYRKRHHIDARTRADAQGQVEAALDRVEVERQGGAYLVGNSFSVADLTAAALLSPLVQPPELGTRLPPGSMPEDAGRFRDRVSSHPAFCWVQDIYRTHRGESAAV